MESFGLTPTATAAHTAALAQLTASRDGAKSADHTLGSTAGWGARVLQAAEELLGNFVEQVLYLFGCCIPTILLIA